MERPRHTIVLVQFSQNKNSRSYIDYESISQALDGICQLYEQGLKVMNPSLKNITYDISDLYNYVDNLGDLCCLVYNAQSNSYIPHNKEWIKARVFEHLKKQAIM
uniref:Enhancer of rudimentary homolog n=2 Tax=Oxyrrhis marina TaxID=2969 RepID=A7WQD6_OXYMA|nr:rudimentary enhancer [Oxyrrhis marina]|mmetsp:Transcript_3842/g.5919  ORF Transcript_3842/g.5919 Transcript_3842/m.5919 type:complete len:105 (-) Transcript_3842:121-435(-)